MTQPTSDEDFITAWQTYGGSPTKIAAALGISERAVYKRRSKFADKGLKLTTVPLVERGYKYGWQDRGAAYRRQNDFNIDTGTIIVFSDAHWWPDQPISVAHQALLELIKELKPSCVVANGDVFDGARVSRHAPLGWVNVPTVKEELDVCEEFLHEIHMTADPKRCAFFWNIGNHDQRFDRTLAQNAAEFEGAISKLEDRFYAWDFAWSLNVNDHTMIKHRYHNGIHAGYNNTLKSGRSIVTGHLHRLLVTPWGDYNGRRYGVDTGTLSDPLSPQFEYAENNPSPHTSGFAVLNFKDGMLLPPELCEVINGHAYFRGQEVV